MYLSCMFSPQHSRELSMNRGARKSVRESVFLSCWSHQPVLRPALFPTDKLNLSSSYSLIPDIVHENLKMGSDGESDQASGTSSDEVQSPTGVCLRNRGNRRISAEVGFASMCFHCPCMAFLLFKLRTCCLIWLRLTSVWRLNKCR